MLVLEIAGVKILVLDSIVLMVKLTCIADEVEAEVSKEDELVLGTKLDVLEVVVIDWNVLKVELTGVIDGVGMGISKEDELVLEIATLIDVVNRIESSELVSVVR